MSRLDYNPNTRYIASYWADADLTRSGEVFYRQTTDPSLLQRATDEVRAAYTIQNNVTMKNLLIVTWYRIGYFTLDIYDTNIAVSGSYYSYCNNNITIMCIHKYL